MALRKYNFIQVHICTLYVNNVIKYPIKNINLCTLLSVNRKANKYMYVFIVARQQIKGGLIIANGF